MASSSANTPIVNSQIDPRHSGHSDNAVESYTLIPRDLSKDPTKWTRANLQEFLNYNQTTYDLDETDIAIFKDQKVTGAVFMTLTRNDLRQPPYNLADGTARGIESIINELKEPAKEEFGPIIKRFKPNSTVYLPYRKYVYYADQTENNAPLISKIQRGCFLRVYGPRASGKSSRIIDAMVELRKLGYECIYVDLQTSLMTEEIFWSRVRQSCHKYNPPTAIYDPESFLEAFRPERWARPVVFFFDEFDILHDSRAKEACSSILATLRHIRNDPGRGSQDTIHNIHSVVSIGSFAITLLDQTNPDLSPFNATENFSGISLTKGQAQALFEEFANDRGIWMDAQVIESIYHLTGGHAAMVNICGAAIDYALQPGDKIFYLARWQNLVLPILEDVLGYSTFRRMVQDLKNRMDAVDCLRLHFLGNFDEFIQVSDQDGALAQFLAALGVLSPDKNGSKFRMSSPMIDSLIRNCVIPSINRLLPSTPIPKKYNGGPLDWVETLKEAVKVFDKDLIQRAAVCAYKRATVKVDGYNGVTVPRESVYDSELMRILLNWLQQEKYRITGQWHHVVGSSHKYSDIIITRDQHKVVLELLATGGSGFIKEHIERVRIYKDNLSAEEAWVIHFTREDNYLDNPLWQSDTLLRDNINVMHIWHDAKFTVVKMIARYNGGGAPKIERII